MPDGTPSPPVLSVRVSTQERSLLAAAAEIERISISEFVRRNALDSAEMALMDRRVVTIPAADWAAFEAWAARPAEAVPALTELAGRKPAWQS